MGRHFLMAGLLLLGAALCCTATASAQGYGRYAKPRAFHPRSTFGYYRSYPHNYAEYNLSGYRNRGYGFGWGRPYAVPGYGAPGYYGQSLRGYPAPRNYGNVQLQFNFGR
jgi:hypothetical protein